VIKELDFFTLNRVTLVKFY